eukprot:gnl/MRDRNA2_/MRDRNA2_80810_c0_seq1.p1 gnl/MRDRNA2_/MRDRNA2_80810_c0~~gnl/MRDRNA2_/MRDRNA2_80810_c0_seq1.p1  ORF type:complete len:283 (-),score=61.54 gnl/MRDRNA2_/MRDRNA2_80810_c0_seq1:35-883(-)
MKRRHQKALRSFSDEESSEAAPAKRHVALESKKDSASAAQVRSDSAVKVPNKEKEFAWMDSEDESDAQHTELKADTENKKEESDSESFSPCPAPPNSISEITTLAGFLRASKSIRKAVPSMSTDELVLLCETASRLKYYDGDLFAEVYSQLKIRIDSKMLTAAQVTAVASALLDLNAYNVDVFTSACEFLMPQISGLGKENRLKWVDMLTAAKHKGAHAFMEALRTAPLAPGEETIGNGLPFEICWDYANGGFCKRGTSCPWKHDKNATNTQQPYVNALKSW